MVLRAHQYDEAVTDYSSLLSQTYQVLPLSRQLTLKIVAGETGPRPHTAAPAEPGLEP